jgi:hypothetical protein
MEAVRRAISSRSQEVVGAAVPTRRRLEEAWLRGALPAVAAEIGCDLAVAAGIVWDAQLLPPGTKVSRDDLVAIAEAGATSHLALSRTLGISRWTIANWRRRLGLVPDPVAGEAVSGGDAPA